MRRTELLLLSFCEVYPELAEGSHTCTGRNSIGLVENILIEGLASINIIPGKA